MRAVLVDAPADFVEARRRRGADRWDEVWEGVLHMVPPPSELHQRLGTRLLVALDRALRGTPLTISYETGVFDPDAGWKDYRIPDLVVASEDRRSERGIEGGPQVVVEILSENDETYEKLPFYERIGTEEVLILDPRTRRVELFLLRGGKLHAALARDDGSLRSAVLGVTFRTVDEGEPRLEIEAPAGRERI